MPCPNRFNKIYSFYLGLNLLSSILSSKWVDFKLLIVSAVEGNEYVRTYRCNPKEVRAICVRWGGALDDFPGNVITSNQYHLLISDIAKIH